MHAIQNSSHSNAVFILEKKFPGKFLIGIKITIALINEFSCFFFLFFFFFFVVVVVVVVYFSVWLSVNLVNTSRKQAYIILTQ